jgi:hypothetical protein
MRAELRAARIALEQAGAGMARLAPALRALERLERRLARPMRIAIAGEFNSGKSTLANLLAGIETLPTSVVSNTAIPTLLYFAADPEIFARRRDGTRVGLNRASEPDREPIVRLEVGLPAARMGSLEVLDLPGLADPSPEARPVDLARHGVDAVLWCTVCTQAWRESERAAWSGLPARLQRRGVLVATHRDLVEERDLARILARLRQNAGPLFRYVVPIATTQALAALREARGHGASSPAASPDTAALEAALAGLATLVAAERADAAALTAQRIAGRALRAVG